MLIQKATAFGRGTRHVFWEQDIPALWQESAFASAFAGFDALGLWAPRVVDRSVSGSFAPGSDAAFLKQAHRTDSAGLRGVMPALFAAPSRSRLPALLSSTSLTSGHNGLAPTFSSVAGEAAQKSQSASTPGATHWVHPTDGAWNVAANWSAGLPGAIDAAFLDAAGTYVVTSSAGVDIGSLILDAGATLSLNAGSPFIVEGDVLNNGTVEVGAFLGNRIPTGEFRGDVSGTGSFEIADKAILEIGGSVSGQFLNGSFSGITVSFETETGTLVLDQSANFHGLIAGSSPGAPLAPGNLIDLKDLPFTSSMSATVHYDNSSNISTVDFSNGAANVSLLFSGMDLNWKFESDGQGGTIVSDPPTNPIVLENQKPGTPKSVWQIQPGENSTLTEGFATAISTNVGGTSSTGTLLASATFTNEGSSGWQTVTFNNPVSISAGTTYVASFHSNGHYASTTNYFTTARTSGPLTAPASINGVYTYGTGNLFPTSTYNASNYWVDVVSNGTSGSNQQPVATADNGFHATQGVPFTIDGAAQLANDTDPNGDALTITGVSGAANGTASFNAQNNSVTFTSASGFTGPTSFDYSISDGRGGTASASVNVTVHAPSSNVVSLFSSNPTPSVVSANDGQAIEVGMKFQASAPGDIIGLRFYKGPSNTGTHVAASGDGHVHQRNGEWLAAGQLQHSGDDRGGDHVYCVLPQCGRLFCGSKPLRQLPHEWTANGSVVVVERRQRRLRVRDRQFVPHEQFQRDELRRGRSIQTSANSIGDVRCTPNFIPMVSKKLPSAEPSSASIWSVFHRQSVTPTTPRSAYFLSV
ncbi:DUF4082 domain-containing protein [Bradyrhizobium sp. IC3069]|nr:DUF4082 domain-containing protein [Bradyrhizobium sp. IC4059]MCA1519559.1 DUF4082 domain-containing protein [Bradyrhizobium sp. IC3069]